MIQIHKEREEKNKNGTSNFFSVYKCFRNKLMQTKHKYLRFGSFQMR